MVQMGTFSEDLARRDDAALVALLTLRPDLLRPAPTTLRALVTHLTAHASMAQALMRLDRPQLQALESVSVLTSVSSGSGASGTGPTTDDVVRALAGEAASPAQREAVTGALRDLHERALLWHEDPGEEVWRTAPGVDEALGPYPAGLGPDLGGETPQPPDLAAAPAGAAELLAALTWEQPVGRVTSGRHQEVVAWLVRHGVLVAVDAEHVVLPRKAGLVLRGGRTHRGLEDRPVPSGAEVAQAAVDAEAATAALDLLRHTALLARTWAAAPAAMLRAGGLPVRELRRTALALETDDATAAAVVELAAEAGLVADDGDEPASFVTVDLDDWLSTPPAEQWGRLVRAWVHSPRTPWAVGTRDERGAARAALAADLERPWVVPLRRRVLAVLAQNPGRTLDAEQVHAVLAWSSPRAVPPVSAVAALLAETRSWGVTGRGALSRAGRALVAELEADGAAPRTADGVALTAALDAMLPAPVEDLLLQGDLTGVVPGRPAAALESLLDLSSEVESRGAGLTVRFTPASITRALDAGMSGTSLRDALARFSPSPLPQPLEYLVDDVARRHGTVRVGTAQSYVRVADPAVAAAILAHRALDGAEAFLLAPTVVAAQVPAAVLAEAVRAAGSSPVLEAPDGHLLTGADVAAVGRARTRGAGVAAGRRRATSRAVTEQRGGGSDADRARAVVRRLRASGADTDGGSDDDGPGATTTANAAAPGTPDPVGALGVLREAAASGSPVRIEVVGARGLPESRDVVPVRVDGGRIRLRDLTRDSDLTVAVHRLLSATRLPPPSETSAGTLEQGAR